MAFTGNYCQAGGIWNGGSGGRLLQARHYFLPGGEFLRRDLDEALGSYFAFAKSVDSDAVAGVTWLLAFGIREGSHRGV